MINRRMFIGGAVAMTAAAALPVEAYAGSVVEAANPALNPTQYIFSCYVKGTPPGGWQTVQQCGNGWVRVVRQLTQAEDGLLLRAIERQEDIAPYLRDTLRLNSMLVTEIQHPMLEWGEPTSYIPTHASAERAQTNFLPYSDTFSEWLNGDVARWAS